MGTCCNAHLTTKIRDYALNAENGAVTVTVIENPRIQSTVIPRHISPVRDLKHEVITTGICDYCKAPAEFTVSYFPKKEG